MECPEAYICIPYVHYVFIVFGVSMSIALILSTVLPEKDDDPPSPRDGWKRLYKKVEKD